MNFTRLYEFKKICDELPNPSDCYFHDLDELLKNEKSCYTTLDNELNRLDEISWEFLKKECSHDLCQNNNKRGWTQLFNKLNEAKGYGYLVDKGCHIVEFIPTSKINGVETPDLKGSNEEANFLCEVKTINLSDFEIQRRANGSVKEVCYELNDGLRFQLSKVIDKAKSQLKSYQVVNVKGRIVFVVVYNDDWQLEAKTMIYPKIESYVNNLVEDGIEIKIHFT